MAQQVAGSELDLSTAIQQGEVPVPVLQNWNDWQAWRREFGRRPLQRVDGYHTTGPQESTLWRSTMLEFFGENWAEQLVSPTVIEDGRWSGCGTVEGAWSSASLLLGRCASSQRPGATATRAGTSDPAP